MITRRQIALLALLPALVLAGCGNQKKAEQAAPTARPEGMSGMRHDAGTPTENAVMVTCPVSGHSVARDKAVVITYEGKEVPLCCADCVDPFKADPAKYMAVLEKNEKATH